jgi:GNAT superfamily N-acetyltransferase
MYYQRSKPLRGVRGEEWKKANKRDKRALVKRGKSHAILVYSRQTPVGWCQYGTRDELPRIDAGRNYRKIDQLKVDKLWRITCFFVDKEYRGKGVAKLALESAIKSIQRQGGGIVEAYPVVSEKMQAVAEWRWFGTPSMFTREGFKRIAPLGSSGVLMRKTVHPV